MLPPHVGFDEQPLALDGLPLQPQCVQVRLTAGPGRREAQWLSHSTAHALLNHSPGSTQTRRGLKNGN